MLEFSWEGLREARKGNEEFGELRLDVRKESSAKDGPLDKHVITKFS